MNSNYDDDLRNEWKEWEHRNCKLTFACFLLYLMPLILMLWNMDGGWKIPVTLTMALGIWKSDPGWRRWLGVFQWFLFMAVWRSARVDGSGFLPGQDPASILLLLIWPGAFYLTWYADGQAYKRSLRRSAWED